LVDKNRDSIKGRTQCRELPLCAGSEEGVPSTECLVDKNRDSMKMEIKVYMQCK